MVTEKDETTANGHAMNLNIKVCGENKANITAFLEPIHCVKSVQIRNYFWSLFSRILTE